MTVTFTAVMGAIVAHVITCTCKGAIAQAPRYGSYVDAMDALLAIPFGLEHRVAQHRSVLPGCTEPELCLDYPLSVHAVEDVEAPEVNVTNANADLILDALGYNDFVERIGDAAPDDFRGRVLTALAFAPVDEGMPSYQVTSIWIEGGRPPGYIQDRLIELLNLADWCAEHNRPVQWH